MPDKVVSAVAASFGATALISTLFKDYNGWNEGQKAIINNTNLDYDVSINVTNGTITKTYSVENNYWSIDCPHEEAFGDLFEEAIYAAKSIIDRNWNRTILKTENFSDGFIGLMI